MAKEIRWSVRADQERIDILDYWLNRNKSPTYSIRLAKLITKKTEQLALHPDIGVPTKEPLIKVKIVKEYVIYYQINVDHINIITIWDSRRDPKKLKL